MMNPNNTSHTPAEALRIAGTHCPEEAESRSVISWPRPSPEHNPAQPQHSERCCFRGSPQQNEVCNHIREPSPAPVPVRGLLQCA